MICKVCKEEIDDRLTRCPFCGTATNAQTQQEQNEFEGRFSDIQSGGRSIFDSEEFEEDAETVEEVYEDDDTDSPEKNNRYKYIVAGLTVAIVAFVIVLLCILYFSGVIGGKSEPVTTAEITTEAPTVLTTQAPTTEKPTTTAPTTEATTVDYGEGIRRPDYVSLELKEGKATVNSLNIRKSPTTDEDNRITAMAQDSKVTIYGADAKEDAGWYFIYYNAEKIYGWVSSDYIEFEGKISFKTTGDSTPTITEEPTKETTAAENTEADTTVEEEEPEEVTTAEEATAAETDKLYEVTAEGGLNFRSSPDSEADNYITTLVKGAKLKLVKLDGDWAQVYYEENDITGWVSAKYIKEIQ
ncbi:MAG: SH3 domain-containing protein [Clostridia bacterium]|nr:SH3 domain-containing protein [Clostridia bacterium]